MGGNLAGLKATCFAGVFLLAFPPVDNKCGDDRTQPQLFIHWDPPGAKTCAVPEGTAIGRDHRSREGWKQQGFPACAAAATFEFKLPQTAQQCQNQAPE